VSGHDGALGVVFERDEAARIESLNRRAGAHADIFAVTKQPDFRILKQG
jgi:hypothetical protein